MRGQATIEISHEALLWAWPRLREWLAEDRDGQRIHRDITIGAQDWRAAGGEPSRLFGGLRLAVARDWWAGHDAELNPQEREFLEASKRCSQVLLTERPGHRCARGLTPPTSNTPLTIMQRTSRLIA
jgi:hypothetical protein